MAIRPILVIPDPRLRQVATPVEQVDEDLKNLISDMFETMYDAPGIGLAAPQIGILKRLIVVDCGLKKHDSELEEPGEHVATEQESIDAEEGRESERPEDEEEPDPIAMINPEILWFSDELSVHEEGCLSIPDYYEDVERPARCKVGYTDPAGNRVEREIEGLLSTCVQHEIDHLNGKLFIDYLSRLKREMVTKKFKKAAKHASD